MKEAKKLSIIITAYRKAELLSLCISALRENIDNLDYEIIVVSSATDEATYDVMREEFSDVQFLPHKENKGFGYLANRGIERAKGEYLFIINHDIIVTKGAVEKLLEYCQGNPEVGIVGPELVNFDGTVQLSAFKFYSWRTILFRRTFLGKFRFAQKHLDEFLLKDKIVRNGTTEVDWLMGSATMTSMEAVKKVGLFDERFFMYFEDVDWCWRFWQAGYKVVYNTEVRVAHYHGKASLNKSVWKALIFNKYTRIHILSAWKFFLKHFGEPLPRQDGKK